MHKRVLIAEESDTIRSVTESILRQSGFEVISVTSGERALEVLTYTKPDIVLVASAMLCKNNKPLYEQIQDEPQFAHIPHLVMITDDDPDLMLPEEILLKKPFEPKDLLHRIQIFTGDGSKKQQPVQAGNPLGQNELDDELLDMALGIDQFEVTDSEVMNKTSGITVQQKKKKSPEKMIGYDHADPDTEITNSESGKVESLMIHDEQGEIQQNQAKRGKKGSGTGKLEILNDQFGLIDSEPFEQKHEGGDHDYEWFLNELQKEESGQPAEGKPAQKKQAGKSAQGMSDSQELSFTDTSAYVDPVTPPKAAPKPNKTQPAVGVDNFIDEFKKEIEKIGSDLTDSVTLGEEEISAARNRSGDLSWEDSIEKITPQDLALFKKQFVESLAQKLALIIASKIDADKLLMLLKQEIVKQAKKSNNQ